MQDMARKGRNRHPVYFGEEHPRAKLTNKKVREIKLQLLNYHRGMYRGLAKEYNVNKQTIINIDRGINWKTVN